MRVVRMQNDKPDGVVMAGATESVARTTAALLNRQDITRQSGISFMIEDDVKQQD